MAKRTPKQRQRIIDAKIMLKGVLMIIFIPWTVFAFICLNLFYAAFFTGPPPPSERALTWGLICFCFFVPVFWVSTLRWLWRFDPYRLPVDAEPIIDEPPAASDSSIREGSPPPWLGPPVDPRPDTFREGKPPTRPT